MNNLAVLNEIITNGFTYTIISVISLMSLLCGIFVIVSKNPIVSVLFLIGLFITIAGYLMMLGMNFIGLSYLLVYVGAVSILFLFILMLINIRISELTSDSSNSIPMAIITGIFFNISLYHLLPSNVFISSMFFAENKLENIDIPVISKLENLHDNFDKSANLFLSDNIFLATSQSWDVYLSETSHISSIGNIIYTNYPIWLILTSLILLLAMVGAIVITIKK
jgi:NADH-ubiquinone oxidoreductase chain 6